MSMRFSAGTSLSHSWEFVAISRVDETISGSVRQLVQPVLNRSRKFVAISESMRQSPGSVRQPVQPVLNRPGSLSRSPGSVRQFPGPVRQPVQLVLNRPGSLSQSPGAMRQSAGSVKRSPRVSEATCTARAQAPREFAALSQLVVTIPGKTEAVFAAPGPCRKPSSAAHASPSLSTRNSPPHGLYYRRRPTALGISGGVSHPLDARGWAPWLVLVSASLITVRLGAFLLVSSPTPGTDSHQEETNSSIERHFHRPLA